jgi:transcriptional regulator with XRE-family HTH domain
MVHSSFFVFYSCGMIIYPYGINVNTFFSENVDRGIKTDYYKKAGGGFMNERLKAVRKALKLSQAEFGGRIGVQNNTISRLESGERNFTDQMILSLCKEYAINEEWLRTGVGEMFKSTENPVIKQLAAEYHMSEKERLLFETAVETYFSLPELYRRVVADSLATYLNIYIAAKEKDKSILDAESTHRLTLEDKADDYRAAWNKGLTEEEAVTLVRKRYAAAREEPAVSTTSEKAGSA